MTFITFITITIRTKTKDKQYPYNIPTTLNAFGIILLRTVLVPLTPTLG